MISAPYRLPFVASITSCWLNLPTCTAMVILLFGLSAASVISSSAAPASSIIPPGYSSEIIQVKFREGTNLDQPMMALPPDLRKAVSRITTLFTLPKERLDKIRAGGRSPSGKALPDLSLWYKITLTPGTDAAAVIEHLRRLPNVEIVEPAPLPAPPPAITPDFTGQQGYLGAAPGGIEARYSWTIQGGDGSGITIYDVEYNWLQTHEDLSKANGIALLLNPGDSNDPPGYPGPSGTPGCPAPCDPINREHGTAVLGEIIADNDTKGVTGISRGANIGLAPVNTANQGYNPGNAILLAVADGAAGDVILIEQQAAVCGLPCNQTQVGCGPLEWTPPVFEAIQTAVANGIVVVEAAGNGAVDLDQAACGDSFNRSVRDSGAIIVGAGRPPGGGADRQREPTSTYGSRVDVQGWGSRVTTTGRGTLYTNSAAPNNPDFWYTGGFSGTSSASPMVAGAAANLQGISRHYFGVALTAFQIRALLVETGSPQLGNTSQHIGPRPNLREAIAQLQRGPIDLYLLMDLSNSFADDLLLFKAQAPSIISDVRASHPQSRFGLGRFEDYPISPFGSAADGDKAYAQVVDLTDDIELALSTIAGLVTRSGSDAPQSQLPALFQAVTGAGQDLSGLGFPEASIPPGQQANFQNGATKLLLLWTDAPFHFPGDSGDIPYPGPSFEETVAAILALDPPKVIGISSGGDGLADLEAIAAATKAVAPPGGVSCGGDGIIDIREGNPLVCTIASSGRGIGEAITALVKAATKPTLEETRAQQVHPPAVGPLPSEEAPPRSEPLARVAGPAEPEETREARVLRIRSNAFKRAGAPNVLVVRARVQAVEAEERPLPAALGWGEDPAMQVATRVSLDLVDEICGRAGGSPTLTAWYAGGVLPSGRGFRTSQMMADPVPGQEYIFWLQKLDGDWFLASGRHDMFDVRAQDTYVSWPEKATLSARALQGACQ